MEDLDECEFSVIYESIDDSESDEDEYVTMSQPSPYTYMCPEPKERAPPPPTDVATWDGPLSLLQAKKPKRRQPLPPVATSNTTHLLAAAPSLPQKPHPERPKHKHLPFQRSMKYSEEPSPIKPKRPPKPGYLAGNTSSHPVPPSSRTGQGYQAPPLPQTVPPSQHSNYPYHHMAGQQQHGHEFSKDIPQPTHPHQQQSSQVSTGNEPVNEYDSIKETRRMIAARRKHLERARAQEPVTGEDGGGGGAIQMDTISIKGRKVSSGSREELVSTREELVSSGESGRYGPGQSRVVGVLLSIAVVSLLIAVASLVLSLYGVAAINTRRMNCSHDIINTQSKMIVDTTSMTAGPLQADDLMLHTLSGVNCVVGEVGANSSSSCHMSSTLVHTNPSLNGSYCLCTATCVQSTLPSTNITMAAEPVTMECHMVVTRCKYQ